MIPNLTYGPSDYNVTKAFKIFGMWQPVIFQGERGWMEKIAGGWSLSGIFNSTLDSPGLLVTRDRRKPLLRTMRLSATFTLRAYLGGAGTSTSNDAFKTGSNYPLGGTAYFATPTYTAYNCSPLCAGTALPQVGVTRNSLTGPGYRDLDIDAGQGLRPSYDARAGGKCKDRVSLGCIQRFQQSELQLD